MSKRRKLTELQQAKLRRECRALAADLRRLPPDRQAAFQRDVLQRGRKRG